MKMREIEYYRCWAGSGGDSGQWDTDYIEIPADTPDDQIEQAVENALAKVEWREDHPPVATGIYWIPPVDDELEGERR